MKLFGSIRELVATVWRKDGQAITARPNQSTTYTADRDIQTPPQDANSVLVSENATQTLTNKTLSGASNTITNVSLTTGVTGVLPTANGGTGQNSTATFPASGVLVTEAGTQTLTNKTIAAGSNTISGLANANIAAAAAIDATKIADGTVTSTEFQYIGGLTSDAQTQINAKQADVITTQGDLVIGNASGDPVRLGIGGSGTVLTSNGTTASWVTGTGESVHSVSGADYTILDGDGYTTIIVDTTGTNRTITLPPVATNANRKIRIIKTNALDSDGTGACIVDGNSSETIAGDASIALYAANDRITVQNSGSRWEIVNLIQTEYASNDGDMNFGTGNADDTTHFYYAAAGVGFPSGSFTGGHIRRVRFLTAPTIGTNMWVEIDAYNTSQFQISTGTIYGGTTYVDDYNAGDNSGIGRLERISSTDWDVNLGRYAYAPTTNWAAAHANMKWRVVKRRVI